MTGNGSSQAGALGQRSAMTPPAAGGTTGVGAGADTSCGGAKQCFNCRGIGHLQHQCPSKAGAASSRGKQAARGHYDSSSNVSNAASSSSGGNRKPPPPKQHPRARTSGGGGQPSSQGASTSGATTAGRKRARDVGLHSPLTSRRQEAPGSPTLRRWSAAREWCWSA